MSGGMASCPVGGDATHGNATGSVNGAAARYPGLGRAAAGALSATRKRSGDRQMRALEIIVTVGLGAAGLALAHSVRRQLQVKTADARTHAYTVLWEAMKLAAPSRNEPLSLDERRALHKTMTDWYFDGGHGMLMPSGTGNLFKTATTNLVCPIDEVRPTSLIERLRRSQDPTAERGCLSIAQLRLLRTRMKADLAVYGRVYDRKLTSRDTEFLRHCGESLLREPWREPLRTTIRARLPRPRRGLDDDAEALTSPCRDSE